LKPDPVKYRPQIIWQGWIVVKLRIAVLITGIRNPTARDLQIGVALIHLIDSESLQIVLHGEKPGLEELEERRDN
jgi:hypothetical protein